MISFDKTLLKFFSRIGILFFSFRLNMLLIFIPSYWKDIKEAHLLVSTWEIQLLSSAKHLSMGMKIWPAKYMRATLNWKNLWILIFLMENLTSTILHYIMLLGMGWIEYWGEHYGRTFSSCFSETHNKIALLPDGSYMILFLKWKCNFIKHGQYWLGFLPDPNKRNEHNEMYQ